MAASTLSCPSFEEWRLTHPPIAGGAPDDPPPDDPPKDDPPVDDPPKDDPPKDDPSDQAAALRAENQRLKREAAAREKERRQAEAQAKKAEDERKAEQGEWKKLAEERSEKIAELEAMIADRDRRDAERDQRTTVEAAAEKLNFKRPKRAYAILVDELGTEKAAETFADEQLTEAALKRIARNEPELVDNQRRSGAPVNGGGGGGGLTPQQRANRTIAGLLRSGTPQD